MAQYLKPEIGEQIAAAALQVFAEKGYRSATIAEIASRAGTATGNVYRYYENKDALLEHVIGPEFVRTFNKLLKARVTALSSVSDLRAVPPDAPYFAAAEELLRFSFKHRLRVVVLLRQAAGSRYERSFDEAVELLCRLALTHFRKLGKLKSDEATLLVLRRLYRNFVATAVELLAEYDEEPRLRRALGALTRYHLAGVLALLG